MPDFKVTHAGSAYSRGGLDSVYSPRCLDEPGRIGLHHLILFDWKHGFTLTLVSWTQVLYNPELRGSHHIEEFHLDNVLPAFPFLCSLFIPCRDKRHFPCLFSFLGGGVHIGLVCLLCKCCEYERLESNKYSNQISNNCHSGMFPFIACESKRFNFEMKPADVVRHKS